MDLYVLRINLLKSYQKFIKRFMEIEKSTKVTTIESKQTDSKEIQP